VSELAKPTKTKPDWRDNPQYRGLRPLKKGDVLNPKGRPKGSKNKLSEKFLKALSDDFQDNGKKAIETMREKYPDRYCVMIAGLLPKEARIESDGKSWVINAGPDLTIEDWAREYGDVIEHE